MCRFIYMIICIFLLCFFYGCSSPDPNNAFRTNTIKVYDKGISEQSTKNLLHFAQSGQKGVSLGLYNMEGIIENDYIFYINKGEPLKKILSIGHFIDEQWTYKLLLFVDYKKTNFMVEGIDVNDYTFKITPNTRAKIPIQVYPLEKGFHDVIFVIAKYPDIKSLDSTFRRRTNMGHILTIRFNIAVENSVAPEITYYTDYEVRQNPRINGMIYTTTRDVFKEWLIEKAKPQTDIIYYYHIGNKKRAKTQSYALVALLDWEPVQLTANGDKVLFLKINENEMVTFPSTIKTPSQEGIYDFSAILVYNPYEKLNIQNRLVETSFRVGLDVSK